VKPHLFIGDVQGCHDELLDLLAASGYDRAHHQLAFVGDLVNRGPKSRAVVELARRESALVVRGNHEDALLRGHSSVTMDRVHAEMDRDLIDWIRSWPIFIRTPDWILVHGGIPPGETPESADKDDPSAKRFEASESYLKAVESAEREAERAVELAHAPAGIPATGMLSVLRRDSKTQGPRLFKRYCASCHTHADSPAAPAEPSAPDLTGFGSRAWIAGLLDPAKIDGPQYFGGTQKHKGGEMSEFVKEQKPVLA